MEKENDRPMPKTLEETRARLAELAPILEAEEEEKSKNPWGPGPF